MAYLIVSIYIDGITEVTLSSQSCCVLYADDVLLYCAISYREDFLAIQSDIETLEELSDKQLLQLNPEKCKSMILSKKRQVTAEGVTLYLGGTSLDLVETFKYLGVYCLVIIYRGPITSRVFAAEQNRFLASCTGNSTTTHHLPPSNNCI